VSDLVVIVPSRNRAHVVKDLRAAFEATCTADTNLRIVVDRDDPTAGLYPEPKQVGDHRSMVDALNREALIAAGGSSRAIAFMGDDHRPRTVGWDAAYLDALEKLPGLVYGNDLIQGANLPTQVAMSTEVVRALGHMAPPPLTHLYVDNYWLALGRATGCITYLPDVVVEHVHPIAGKTDWDDGYRRVNDRSMYERDAKAFEAYWNEHGARDVAAVRKAVAA